MPPDEPVKTYSSQEARENWRELLQDALRGKTAVITLYGDPIAVLIPYDQYQPQDDAHG